MEPLWAWVCAESDPQDQSPQPGAEVAPVNVVPKDGAVIEPSHHHVVQDSRSIEARFPRHFNQLPSSPFGSNVLYDGIDHKSED